MKSNEHNKEPEVALPQGGQGSECIHHKPWRRHWKSTNFLYKVQVLVKPYNNFFGPNQVILERFQVRHFLGAAKKCISIVPQL